MDHKIVMLVVCSETQNDFSVISKLTEVEVTFDHYTHDNAFGNVCSSEPFLFVCLQCLVIIVVIQDFYVRHPSPQHFL